MVTPRHSQMSLTLKNGSPRFMPQALASLYSAIMIPSLLDKTATGLLRKSGR